MAGFQHPPFRANYRAVSTWLPATGPPFLSLVRRHGFLTTRFPDTRHPGQVRPDSASTHQSRAGSQSGKLSNFPTRHLYPPLPPRDPVAALPPLIRYLYNQHPHRRLPLRRFFPCSSSSLLLHRHLFVGLLCPAMEISRIDTVIDRLQNYGIINSLLHELPDIGSLCASIVVILAASAAFVVVVVVRQTELLILRRRKGRSGISQSVTAYSDNDSCSSSDDDDDTDEEEEEEEVSSSDEYESSCGSGVCGDDDWEHDGNSRSRPLWPELGLGGAVVKTWEGLGLGLDRSGGLISLLDLNRGEVLRSFLPGGGQIPAASLSSPAVVLSAAERVGAAAVRVWDARVGGQAPSAAADWRLFRRRRVVGVGGGGEGKVYVSDDVGAVSVADLRNFRSPLRETLWEADAVNVDDLTGSGQSGSVVSWCRNAVRCLPLLPSSN